MSQGKKYTEEQKDKIINSLQDFLRLGYSRNKACELIGLTPQTLSLWIKADEALLMKVKGWENEINVMARKNWRDSIQLKKDLKASQEWLQVKERDEFGRNLDLTTKNDKINITGIEWVIDDGISGGSKLIDDEESEAQE